MTDTDSTATTQAASDGQAQDAAPPMPQVNPSQIAMLGITLLLGKYDIKEMGYTTHVEIGFVVSTIFCVGIMAYIYTRINAMPEPQGGPKVKVPEQTALGKVTAPATEMFPKEYDNSKCTEQVRTLVTGAVVVGCVYWKWRYIFPLAMSAITNAVELVDSPLFKIHILGKTDVARPFPAKNPLGLPEMPQMPKEEEEPAAAPIEEKAAGDKAEKSSGEKKKD
mmetsp:Transcript_49168/g.117107  ORF Transcript_49168/g.117107 Transcript_49168/m.117107 type:complete len:222 (-) Transcript_49168:92-757(-)